MASSPALAACLVLGLAGAAHAGGPGAQTGKPAGQGQGQATAKTSKVAIETEPPGATVYFNSKEDGAVCTTPCTIDAPIGETPIIVEAANRRPLIENLIVPKKTARPLRFSYTLRPALGALVIEGGDGAAIRIDDQGQGVAPRRFDDLPAGHHHVVLERDGAVLYDAVVEVEVDGEATVAPRAQPAAPASDAPGIAATAGALPGPGRPPELAVALVTDIGFRQFSYSNNKTPQTQRDDREVGQILTGASAELWPTTLLHLGMLPGLALYARFEIGVNPQRVTVESATTHAAMNTALTTSWRSLEISLHHRWATADIGSVEVGAGYTDDRYRFNTDGSPGGPDDLRIVPDAAYRAVRIGGRGSLVFGRFEPYLAAENRLVLSGGAMDKRYKLGTSVNGVQGALGVAVHLGQFEARLEGRLLLYSWTFRPDVDGPDQADGGSDLIEHIGIALGYVR